MFGRIFGRDRLLFMAAGERARRSHERWLNRAMRDRTRVYPTIPLRRVADGGFAPVTSTREGRAWADMWWQVTLDQVDS